MKLTSRYNGGQVYWRTFNRTDSVYIFGLSDGFLTFGQTVDIRHNDVSFQMEIKKGDLFGPFIIGANTQQQWKNDDERILNAAGHLVVPDHSPETIVPAKLDARIKYTFGGNKSEFESVNRDIIFSGPAAQRRVDLGELVIQRAARITVNEIHGAFDPGSGKMSLSAKVAVDILGLHGEAHIALNTSHAASPKGTFSETGVPFDKTTNKVKLVGAGIITTPIESEFAVIVDITMSRSP